MNDFCENIEVCKKELINAALNAGGYDNVTIALLEVVEDNEEIDVANTCEIATKKNNRTKKRKKDKKGSRAVLFGFIFIIILLLIIALMLKDTELLSSIRESMANSNS